MKKIFSVALIFMGLASPVLFASASASLGSIDSAYKYAWSNNVGWINFGCTGCNVQITNSTITGYAWSENYGWINLNPTTGGVRNDGAGNLSGYAWGESLGWINFSGTKINSGRFTGTATGDTIGTLNFDCTSSGCPAKTDWRSIISTGGSSYSPATSTAPPAAPVQTPTQTPISPTTTTSFPPLSFVFRAGQTSGSARELQEMLSQDPAIYSGPITGTYDENTVLAVEKFQDKYNIAHKGQLGYGNAGIKTKTLLNSMYASVPAGQSGSTTSQSVQNIKAQIILLMQQVITILKARAQTLK